MYARVSALEGPPELMDETLRQAREVVLSQGRLMEGFKGMIALGDRHSGRTLGDDEVEVDQVFEVVVEIVVPTMRP